MVKADGYGHGMLEAARAFAAEGAWGFGVAEVWEGVRLREAGFGHPVLVMDGHLPHQTADLVRWRLAPVLTDAAQLEPLARAAQAAGRTVACHLKVDMGMGRQGFLPEDAAALLADWPEGGPVRLEGILAHLPMADDPDSVQTRELCRRFRRWLDRLPRPPGGRCLTHLANSGGLFFFPQARFHVVRPGIALYGCPPDGRVHADGPLARLRPAMRAYTRIVQVRRLPAGHGLGYGHIHTTVRPSRIALLPVGYANGYLRCLSATARVLVRGRRCPVVGRISMNLTMVDVTEVPEAEVGDEAVLLGRQGDAVVTADELAGWAGTISYEMLCLLGNLNRRTIKTDLAEPSGARRLDGHLANEEGAS